jgi:hypothetical protein
VYISSVVNDVIVEWNPIKFIPFALNEQYYSEIMEIIQLISIVKSQDAKSVDEIALAIHEVFVKRFGYDHKHSNEYKIEKCYQIALKIWSKL